MNKFIFLFFIILLINSCKSLKQALGVDKDPPDAFLIKKIDPIEKPPNYDLLPPDSKVKVKKEIGNNTKKIIDENLKKNSTNNSAESRTSKTQSSIESDILNKIDKKND